MASAGADGLGVTTMGSNVVQSVIDSMQGMYPGQPAPGANGLQPPRGPAGQAIATQTPLLQTSSIDNMPGMTPGSAPRGLAGYPGQMAPPANFAQQPAQFPAAAPGPAPGTFGYARDRAFDQAGGESRQGNYAAAAGNALRGVGAAIPAAAVSAYQSVADSATRPLPQREDPLVRGAQEFWRGLTGASAPAPVSPPLPEFNQQVQQLQPPRPAAFPSNAPIPMQAPSFGPTNRDVVGASLQAHQPNGVVSQHDWGNGKADVRDLAANARGGLPGGPTTNAWYDQLNTMLAGHGVAAGNRIFDAATHGVPFSEIAAATPGYDAEARTGQQPVRMLDPTGRHLYMDEGNQPQGRGGPVQGAIATQQPMSDREAFYQTLPPHMAAAIRTGHFSRDQVVHLLGQVAPQMTHERDPVWVGKNASANALSGMANLTAHGVTEDKNGNVVVDPRTLQLPADRLRALGADPANGDVAAQLIYQYNVHKRTNSIWSQFFNSIIPLMQQGQEQ